MTPLDHFRRMPQDQRMQAYRIVDYDTKEWTWYEPRAAQLVLREAMRKHNRVLVPKARRLGASTEVEAYLFDALLMADRPLPIATMAHVDRAAKNIAGMLRGMYDGLPAGLRPKASKLNDSQIVLEESGANQTVYMAGAHGQPAWVDIPRARGRCSRQRVARLLPVLGAAPCLRRSGEPRLHGHRHRAGADGGSRLDAAPGGLASAEDRDAGDPQVHSRVPAHRR